MAGHLAQQLDNDLGKAQNQFFWRQRGSHPEVC
jgi:hypothetical protein